MECITDKPDGRPAIVCNDAEDLVLARLELTCAGWKGALIELESVHRASITGMRMPAGAKVVAKISGPDSSGLSFSGNALSPTDRPWFIPMVQPPVRCRRGFETETPPKTLYGARLCLFGSEIVILEERRHLVHPLPTR